MGVGRGEQGGQDPLDFENLGQKRLFNFDWEQPNFTAFGPPWKNFGKIP